MVKSVTVPGKCSAISDGDRPVFLIKIHVLLIVAGPKPKLSGGWSPNHFGPMDPSILGIVGKLLSMLEQLTH